MGHEKAIILSTHILEEVEAVCSRVLVIDKGRKVFDGTPESLRAKSHKSGSLIVEIASMHFSDVKDKLDKVQSVLRSELIREDADSTICRLMVDKAVDSALVCHNVFELCRAEDWQPVELKVDHGRLDEVFHELTITNA
jgi:ABC-2 type transport system ATP-binding protein